MSSVANRYICRCIRDSVCRNKILIDKSVAKKIWTFVSNTEITMKSHLKTSSCERIDTFNHDEGITNSNLLATEIIKINYIYFDPLMMKIALILQTSLNINKNNFRILRGVKNVKTSKFHFTSYIIQICLSGNATRIICRYYFGFCLHSLHNLPGSWLVSLFSDI